MYYYGCGSRLLGAFKHRKKWPVCIKCSFFICNTVTIEMVRNAANIYIVGKDVKRPCVVC